MTSQTEIRKATDRTLPYLLDRELEALQSRTIVRTYHRRAGTSCGPGEGVS